MLLVFFFLLIYIPNVSSLALLIKPYVVGSTLMFSFIKFDTKGIWLNNVM